jgi:release factor glutamine methyltransferase
VGGTPDEDERLERFQAMVARRARREPLQHVLGHWPFLELDLLCDGRALIPRPETEDLAELARARLRSAPPPRCAIDVGTGSGCLALALAAGDPDARVLAIDLDDAALSLARENAERAGVAERVTFLQGDLLAPLTDPAGPPPTLGDVSRTSNASGPGLLPAALIVANLPYVAPSEWDGLQPEVRDHDPRGALVADEDGLALIRRLVAEAPAHLRPDGALMLEMAPPQLGTVTAWLGEAGFGEVTPQADRFGRLRFVSASCRGGA